MIRDRVSARDAIAIKALANPPNISIEFTVFPINTIAIIATPPYRIGTCMLPNRGNAKSGPYDPNAMSGIDATASMSGLNHPPILFRSSTKPTTKAMIVVASTAITQSCCENAYKTRHPAAMPNIMAGPPGRGTITLPGVCAFGIVYIFTPFLIRWLKNKKITVPNAHTPGNVMVPRPGGPAIMLGIAAGCLVLYAFSQQDWVIAVLATTIIAFVVGLVDDLKRMGGWFKPLMLAVASIPLIALGSYGPDLAFPLFGSIHVPILYGGVAIIAIVLMGNTVNSIDIFGGLASAFIAIASLALTLSLIILQNYEVAIASAILVSASIAYYKFHKIPCLIFPGDSGALALGAAYGAIAIVGGVEIIAAVAMLPAVVNSFLFLSATKRIIEYRNITKKSVALDKDFKLFATSEKGAIPSLISIILAGDKPKTDAQLVKILLRFAVLSGCMAVVTAFMMLVTLP